MLVLTSGLEGPYLGDFHWNWFGHRSKIHIVTVLLLVGRDGGEVIAKFFWEGTKNNIPYYF